VLSARAGERIAEGGMGGGQIEQDEEEPNLSGGLRPQAVHEHGPHSKHEDEAK